MGAPHNRDTMTTSPPRLFDRRLRDIRRRRAHRLAVDGADFLLRAAADDLTGRLDAVQRRFALAADIGSATPYLAERLAGTGRAARVIRLDGLAEARPDIVADADLLPLGPASVDLAVSALALQWSDDLPGVLAQVCRVLRPDGLFLAVLAGGDTLIELREALTAAEAEIAGGASPRVIPFVRLADMAGLMQRAGFALPVVDREVLTVRYASARRLMHDLRAMGATSPLVARSRRPLSRAILARAEAVYAERFADPDGRLRATFDLISASGWAPHDSQQRPLKPGTAARRLADALGTEEQSAGEKAGRDPA